MKLNASFSQRKRYPATQRAEMLQAYQRSGLTQRQFAQQQGLGFSTFTSWLRRARGKPPRPAAHPTVQLLPVQTIATAVGPLYQVRWPNGLTLALSQGFQPEEVRQLVHLLTPCSH